MKVSDVIRQADALRPNTLSDEQKAAWVEEMDLTVENMMLDVRGLAEAVKNYSRGIYDKRMLACLVEQETISAADYKTITGEQNIVSPVRAGRYPAEDWQLLLPAPHEKVYVLQLVAEIDFYNQETDLYANDRAMFNEAWAEAQAWWRRENRPRAVNGWVV